MSGFCVAVPVTVTVLDRVGYVARVDGASMQVKSKKLSIRSNTIFFFLPLAHRQSVYNNYKIYNNVVAGLYGYGGRANKTFSYLE